VNERQARVMAKARGKVAGEKATFRRDEIEILLRLAEVSVVSWESKPRIGSLSDVVQACKFMQALDHEEMWLLLVNAQNRLIDKIQVSQGGHNQAAVTPRDILRPALMAGAAAFVCVHNHPSGDPTMSEDDLRLTRTLKTQAESLGVPMLDHCVIARGGVFSYAAEYL
jgi:DNA repair protein RadC